MQKGIAAKVAGLMVAAGMLVAAGSLHANAPASTISECTLTVDGTLAARPGEQELKVKPSADLAGQITAQFADEARIRVASIERDGEMLKLKVDAGAATAGKWALTLRAGEAECKGDVEVSGDERDAR